jgi:penicillin-binding protein 1B
LRTALAKSVNVATVKLAESVGYGKIATLAHNAGLNNGIAGTPSLALGAYEATPLEMAGAYTTFANQGIFVAPTVVSSVVSRDGQLRKAITPETHRVLDPRVAYLMVSMMEEVMNAGTAAGARSRGFRAPAAGKTGTSRDGWFAGFTSELIAVVWVGFDDNRDLRLEGSKSALPVWTEFMKRALKLPAYADTKSFKPPKGIVSASIDPESGGLSTEYCPSSRIEYFIGGTTPGFRCDLHDPSSSGHFIVPAGVVLPPYPTTSR